LSENNCISKHQLEIYDVYLHIKTNEKNTAMKNEFTYRNRQIIEGTNGLFTAYYSNYSSNLTKDFKTLREAKKQIDKWLDK